MPPGRSCPPCSRTAGSPIGPVWRKDDRDWAVYARRTIGARRDGDECGAKRSVSPRLWRYALWRSSSALRRPDVRPHRPHGLRDGRIVPAPSFRPPESPPRARPARRPSTARGRCAGRWAHGVRVLAGVPGRHRILDEDLLVAALVGVRGRCSPRRCWSRCRTGGSCRCRGGAAGGRARCRRRRPTGAWR